jgi:membrane protease YdiL (CAAX protease family)
MPTGVPAAGAAISSASRGPQWLPALSIALICAAIFQFYSSNAIEAATVLLGGALAIALTSKFSKSTALAIALLFLFAFAGRYSDYLRLAYFHIGILVWGLYWEYGAVLSALRGITKRSAAVSFLHSIGILMASYFVIIFIGAALFLAGVVPDSWKVQQKLGDMPPWLLLFAIIGAPLSEELFFRLYLVPRLGPVVSALIFGLSHLAYGSWFEIFSATAIGLVLSLHFYKFRNPIAIVVAHALFNVAPVLLVLIMRHGAL